MTQSTPRDPTGLHSTTAFIALADTLVTDFDVTDLMRRLAEHCVNLLNIAGAGIMIADSDGALTLAASSNDIMRTLEQYEIDIDAGPCLSAYRNNDVIEIHDLERPEQQWDSFAAHARAHGYASMHAFPMRLRKQVIGVLNLYSSSTGPLSPSDRQCGQALADITTIAVLQHRALAAYATTTEQLQTGFTTRMIIEQAKGILTERHHISNDQAFDLMRRHARHNNLKIVDLARDVVASTRTVPDRPTKTRPTENRRHR